MKPVFAFPDRFDNVIPDIVIVPSVTEVATAIGGWQGGASQAFNSVMEQWDAGSSKTTQALTDFESALASVGAQTIQNEQDAQQSVAKTGAVMLNM